MPTKNVVPPGFHARHQKGAARATEFVPLTVGFVRIERDEDGELETVSFVMDDSAHAKAVGRMLKFRPGAVTFISENAISGTQWSHGKARWGHTLEDDTGSANEQTITKEAWIDESIAAMVEPPDDLLAKFKPFVIDAPAIEKLRVKDKDACNQLYKNCSPRTEAEVALLLGLLKEPVKNPKREGHLFSCAEAFKRAKAGKRLLLETLTEMLETAHPNIDDASLVHEVLEAQAGDATGALVTRWVALCKTGLEKDGVDTLEAGNQGHLFQALTVAPGPAPDLIAFFREVVRRVESADAEKREFLERLIFYEEVKKAAA